ncbi:MAG: methyl-accepting chemotaxis protein [Amphritea sp.]
MQLFKDQKIGTKILGVIILLLIMMSGVAGYGMVKINLIGEQLEGIAHEDMPLIELTTEITINQLESELILERALRQAEIKNSHGLSFKEAETKIRGMSRAIDDELHEAEAQLTKAIKDAPTAEIRAVEEALVGDLKELEKAHKVYEQQVFQLLQLIEEDRLVEATALLDTAEKQQEILNHKLEAFLRAVEKLTDKALETAKHAEESALVGMISLTLIELVLGLILGYIVTISVTRPIKSAVSVANRMAEGDFSLDVKSDSKDETGQLLNAMGNMSRRLRKMITEVLGSSAQINASTAELSSVSEQSNQAIAYQQSNTEMVATAITEMVATVQDMAENTAGAAHATQQAKIEAQNGVEVVQNNQQAMEQLVSKVNLASDKMNQLKEDSNDIGGILGVIREIADQTNLLALNAAIEAARAGEQGRGFAVVADEVRSLAQRTQQSTQEIQALIDRLQQGTTAAVEVMNESCAQVEDNSQRAEKVRESLSAITQAVATINDMNVQIASASEQQLAVAEDVNQNVVNISESGDQILSGSKQNEISSEELAKLSGELQALMGRFKLTA